jgi:hypothetical protein
VVDEHSTLVRAIDVVSPVSTLGRVLLGVTSWTFGVPGAALLAGLLVLAPQLATAWAWIFGGFWLLVAVAGHAVALATGEHRAEQG